MGSVRILGAILDYQTSVIFGVIVVIALNQLVIRIGALRSRPAIFWSLQCINLFVVVFVLVRGLPGLERWPAASWALGLMFALRVIQNNGLRSQYLRQDKEEEKDRRRKEMNQMAEQLAEQDRLEAEE